jgi:hypothetical protein
VKRGARALVMGDLEMGDNLTPETGSDRHSLGAGALFVYSNRYLRHSKPVIETIKGDNGAAERAKREMSLIFMLAIFVRELLLTNYFRLICYFIRTLPENIYVHCENMASTYSGC